MHGYERVVRRKGLRGGCRDVGRGKGPDQPIASDWKVGARSIVSTFLASDIEITENW